MFIFLSKSLPLLVYPLGLAALLVAAGLFLAQKPRAQRVVLITALALLWLGGNTYFKLVVVRSLEWRYLPLAEIPEAVVIVLLGGGTEPAVPPRPISELNGSGDRVIYAAHLYQQGKAAHILLSGGSVPYVGMAPRPPTKDMANLLEMMGVPPEALWMQGISRNTYEDALYTAEILRQRGVNRVILVTSAMHMPRAVALFEHQGLEVIPAPVDYQVTQAEWDVAFHPTLTELAYLLLPTASNLSILTAALKEYLGLWVYGLRGWL